MPRISAAILALAILSVPAVAAGETAGEQWEKALLNAKRTGQWPGPKPGQKCLWSERLGACLWYTPSRFDLRR